MEINVCHLYGNLLNTYGDNGNLLILDYYAKQQDVHFNTDLISIDQDFDPDKYDFVFFGGGQDFEQKIVSEDIHNKKDGLIKYIENDGVMLAICGGYQLLGDYYTGANGEKINGIHALDHYTLSQKNHRFIGDLVFENEDFGEIYYGFENHNGMTFLGADEKPLGKVSKGKGNNGKDGSEGAIYRNVFCSYAHGPLLAKSEKLADRLIQMMTEGKDI